MLFTLMRLYKAYKDDRILGSKTIKRFFSNIEQQDTVVSIPDTMFVTSVHHFLEFLFIATPCDEIIADRLVPFPPWSVWVSHHCILTRG